MPILHWLTREQDLHASGCAPFRLLEHVETYGEADSQNMLIQGDNLDALKALLPYYAGKVKCIYIDPPYNTKSAFEHYDDNLEHAQWLSMMYPRLELLRELLSDDGSIWVNLDDNEAHYAKVIMDEVFGRKNFVADIAWRSADSSNNDAKKFSFDHNYILVYSKNINWMPNKIERTENNNAHYTNPDKDPKGPWFSGNLSSPAPRKNLMFEITSPSGKTISPPKNGWRWSLDRINEMIESGEIVFTSNDTKILRKTYLCNQKGLAPSSIWYQLEDTGHNRQAKYEQNKIFPGTNTSAQFKTPKPERLIQRILHIATTPGDLVLDSFLGSGTTAAVAHKMGRRYIGVEIGEHAVTHCIPRLRKVIAGEDLGGITFTQKEKTSVSLCKKCKESLCENCEEKVGKNTNPEQVWFGGGGFRFYRLGEPIFAEDGSIRKDITFTQLAAHVWFAETGIPMQTQPTSPLLGIHEGMACYLLYNGILGDKKANGGNVLTNKILCSLTPHEGPKIIYGERSLFTAERLKAQDIVFKQTPYDIKGR